MNEMTAEDVAAIQRAREDMQQWKRLAQQQRERAERAEQRARLLAAEPVARQAILNAQGHGAAIKRAFAAEAALARVRALCDQVDTYDHPVAWGHRNPRGPRRSTVTRRHRK